MSLRRVFVARLAGIAVFDPLGDQVGRVRDVVVSFSATRRKPRVLGLVVEVPGRRRVFVPITRVTSIDGGQVITTGLVNMRRFEQRPTESLVLADLLDREVTVRQRGEEDFVATVEDVAIEQDRPREWSVTKVFVRRGQGASTLRRLTGRRGETLLVDVLDTTGLATRTEGQSAARLLEAYDDLKPADLAEVIHDLTPGRRVEVASALDDEKLADVIEELPADDQIEILTHLETERAADVLEFMEPDDAADLLSELPEATQEHYLQHMEPDEAAPLRRLMAYDDNTAGGLMTPEPIVLGPEATIAEALAWVRREEVSPALASLVCVCRPPLETPTGRYLGIVHIQRLLREPPHSALGSILDKELEPLQPTDSLGSVTRMLANYNLTGAPVVDEEGHLLGVVTVDDVLDHILPEDWREERHEVTDE
ncbi:magnesium transporter MgtE N-terminal domain-containing protein [Arsenicicoccus sp. oral taxon 190]|uniref:magnesium transporter MgtE N-terminal domain-containing protein n=1 Tax=Arsenicicoccus sp. oral taxon 190 TaxID=1658671 RepID=UPI00067A2C2A|nr:CBS domain-containing protein [Arsenicicoccus sp. oral taxon 190]AKT51380.1 magnesium transporter [Arsenicicoccus sp. oral taxon 190]